MSQEKNEKAAAVVNGKIERWDRDTPKERE